MLIKFKRLIFEIIQNDISLNILFNDSVKSCIIAEVQIAGENHDAHCGAKQYLSSEGKKLKYISHYLTKNEFVILQRSELIEVKTHFIGYINTNGVRVYNEVKNISGNEITLEHVSSFVYYGLEKNDVENLQNLYFYRFTNSHHVECQPIRLNFFDLGLTAGNNKSMKRISGFNTGSWSTKEELPQGIIENSKTGEFIFFQIESNNSWYYEIGDCDGEIYINAGGPNQQFNGWSKKLKPDESFKSVKAAVCFGKSLDEVIGEMTKYRRHIVKKNKIDENLPTIFNEYMHLSWDSPFEGQTKKIAPLVKAMGIDYYVIDCGWHNEEDGNIIYPYVGQWKESKKRYPSGIKSIIGYLHGLGLKAGLWLEPEIIGYLCEDMQRYYDDGCFLKRNGKRITVMGRQFLDFRKNKVTDYLNGIICKLVENYGVDYLKFDYNEDCGAGTESDSDSLGDGLMKNGEAYLDWVNSIMDKYPNIIIETCSSGGLRMDYKTLSYFPLVSTSDQTKYYKYPYIAGNILSAVLPEQAAVWSYPVDTLGEANMTFKTDFAEVNNRVTEEAVIMNMVNSFLGRMHLASHLELLNEKKQAFVKEGVEYYKKLSKAKKHGIPYFPLGFTDFSKTVVASGFRTEEKLYLAVWNLSSSLKDIKLKLNYKIKNIKVAYPRNNKLDYFSDEETLTVKFDKGLQARFFEINYI